MKRLAAFLVLWAVEASALVYVGAPTKGSVVLTGMASLVVVGLDQHIVRTR